MKESSKSDKILFVDDEAHLLNGIKRTLHRDYNLVTALGPEEGMQKIESDTTFAVIVSDMRMPKMDGIEFLNHCKEKCPDSVRVMLTGNADTQTAIEAINKGEIFRFLTKPCQTDVLKNTLDCCLKQYRLITAEKQLLEETLNGSIKALIDILSLTNPKAFSRALRIKDYANQIIQNLGCGRYWALEIATMLSQIGCVTLPSDTLDRLMIGDCSVDNEQNMLKALPDIAINTIKHIPRLDKVINILSAYRDFILQKNENKQSSYDDLCGHVLALSEVIDQQINRGVAPERVLEALKGKKDLSFNLKLLTTVPKIKFTHQSVQETGKVSIATLSDGDILSEDVLTKTGILLMTKGQQINAIVKLRLMNFLSRGHVEDEVSIYVFQKK